MLSTTKPCNNNNVRTIDKSYKNNVICFVNGLFFNQLLNNVWRINNKLLIIRVIFLIDYLLYLTNPYQ